MKRFTLMACAGLMAAAMATPSLAADLPRPAYKAPVFVAPFSWSGFYVGINGGYGWGTSDWSSAVTPDIRQAEGWPGRRHARLQHADRQLGLGPGRRPRLARPSTAPISAPASAAARVGCETQNRWLGTARGRIGYAFDRWLPYFTGGAAYGDVKMTPNSGVSETETRLGWTLGGGVEWAFMGAWSAKLEYLYVDLGTATCSAATCGIDTDVNFKANLVRVGVNYRF